MQFDDLVAHVRGLGLPARELDRRPPREHVLSIQGAVAAGLTDVEFKLDCIERDLATSVGRDYSRGLPPFFTDTELGVDYALAFWPAGFVSAPHEHTDWTVTAVFFHQLEVQTYDLEAARATRRLVEKNLFTAPAGRAGHIYEMGLHSPRNTSAAGSLSLHLVAPNDRPRLEAQVGPIEGLGQLGPTKAAPGTACPLRAAIRAAMELERLRTMARATAELASPRVPGIVSAIEARGGGAPHVEPTTLLVRAWPGVELVASTQGRWSELVAKTQWSTQSLMRVEGAGSALRHIAAADAFRPRELPGKLVRAERLAIASMLVEWGVFRASDATD